MNKQYEILKEILQGEPLPIPDYSEAEGTPKHARSLAFADFTRYLEGNGAWQPEFLQFIPKERNS